MPKQRNKKAASATTSCNNNGNFYYYSSPKSTHCQPENGKVPAHYQECKALLGKATGWQRIFLSQLLTQTTLNIFQQEKLDLISKELKASNRRLCRYCFSLCSWQSPEYYVCPKCGECLNFEFSAFEIAGGGEIDA
jgi:hypothetical protein